MKLLDALRNHAKIADLKFEGTADYSHKLTKGELRERVLRDFLRPFLPNCYGLGSGEVFSSDGNESKQIDIVIYDAVFSVILHLDENSFLFPCESVFGNIEVKSFLDSEKVLEEAIANIRSLKLLKRANSDGLDLTPISRFNLGSGLTCNKTKANPYLGVVFALDGMKGEAVRDHLIRSAPENRETLPDYIFNLKKQYMVSRWTGNLPKEKPCIDCRTGNYNRFVFVQLGEDLLPTFYFVLNTMLNRTRLRQSNVVEENLVHIVGTSHYQAGHWVST